MKKLYKEIPLEKQPKLGEQLLTDIEIMLKLRWSATNWDDRLVEFRKENELRKG